ncbi:MAG: tetratricopeptide repeat protein [Phototrophicaceae bacterium]
MTNTKALELLTQGIDLARQKNIPQARIYIEQAIRLDPKNEMAWLVLASIANTQREQLLCLKRVLELNPASAQAIKMVEKLGIDPRALMGNTNPIQPPAPQPTPAPAPQPNTPPPSVRKTTHSLSTPPPPPPAPQLRDEGTIAMIQNQTILSPEQQERAKSNPMLNRTPNLVQSITRATQDINITGDTGGLHQESSTDPLSPEKTMSVVESESDDFDLDDLDAFLEKELIGDLTEAPKPTPIPSPPPPVRPTVAQPTPPTNEQDFISASLARFLYDDEEVDQTGDMLDEEEESSLFTTNSQADAPYHVPIPTPIQREVAMPIPPARSPAPSVKEVHIMADTADDHAILTPEAPPVDPTIPPAPPPRSESYEVRLKQALQDADLLTSQYLQPASKPANINWTRKRRRAGENEITMVWTAAISALVVVVLLFVLIVVLIGVNLQRSFTKVASNTTPAPVVSATITPTPGFIASATPLNVALDANVASPTPSPTLPENVQRGSQLTLTPTALYIPGVIDNVDREVSELINRGAYDTAIATVQADRTNNTLSSNTSRYYFEALAYAEKGELQTAQQVLEQAEQDRLKIDPNDPTTQALIQAGLAQISFMRAQQNPENAQSILLIAKQYAETALQFEPRFTPPYLIIAEYHAQTGDTASALAILKQGQDLPSLANDVRFNIKRAEILKTAQQYDAAEYEIFYALYIDPANETAHRLQIEIDKLHRDLPTRIIHLETFLFHQPLSVWGWYELGEARLQEGDRIRALHALNRSIQIGEITQQPMAQAYSLRSQLYEDSLQPRLAFVDLTQALALQDDPLIRQRQMYLALEIGDLATAKQHADSLHGVGFITLGELSFVNARLLALQPVRSENDNNEILRLLSGNVGTIPSAVQATAFNLQAQAALELGLLDEALEFVNQALTLEHHPDSHTIKAQVLEKQENYPAALIEYERALTLNELTSINGTTRTAAVDGVYRISRILQLTTG